MRLMKTLYNRIYIFEYRLRNNYNVLAPLIERFIKGITLTKSMINPWRWNYGRRRSK